MADNIGTVYIPAPVIQLKNTQFIENGLLVPQILQVPCRSVHTDIGRYWAVPTKDNGVFTGLWMQPAYTANGTAITKPSYDSFLVLRVRDEISDYTWWLKADLTQYTAACNTCCGDAFTPITYSVPIISPCQTVCDSQDSSPSNYYAVFAAPALGAGLNYVVNGAYNNEQVADFTSTSLDDLISDLNANFGTIGSPSVTIIWTRIGSTIIGTIQDGEGEDSIICLSILTTADVSP